MRTKDPAIAILANLAQRVRLARRYLRRERKLLEQHTGNLQRLREREASETEAWNALQASKAVYARVMGSLEIK